MRNLDVIKGVYRGNGLATNWSIPFEYTDTSQICVTLTTYADGDYTYEIISASDYTINTGAQTVTYPKSGDPITSDQYITVWRSTDLLQLMDLTNQGGAWPESIEASIDKLTQIVQELMEGLSRTLKVNIGDPETPEKKLLDMQDYVLSAASSAIDASASASSANQAAEAAATSEANAAESERLAGGYADTASDAASRAEDSAISARAYNAPDYDNTKTYQPGEVVTYTDGNSYRAIAETTGNEPPNIIYWQKVTDYVGDDFFEVDEYGYIVPMDSPSHSRYWRVDQNGYIVPIEGGDGGYRPDTRSLSSEYLNVTNEGYVKHLRADDIAAQEFDADEVTAEVAAFNSLTANEVNAGNVNAYLAESTGYGIVSGCEPTISGLTVTVGAGIVHLAGGTRKEIAQTNITLDPADDTNPRIDLVYIDADGTVAKITGTTAASPSAPTLPSGGISVCNVMIVAGATTGAVTDSRGMLPRFYNTDIVNVKDFGILGDGTTDVTDSLNTIFRKSSGKTIYFPRGVYMINGDTSSAYDSGGLQPMSNTTLLFEKGAVLKKIPTDSNYYRVIYLNSVQNVTLYGGEILGDRSEHQGSTGEWGYGIFITGDSTDITIEKMSIRNAWGDGIFVGNSVNVTIENNVIDNCRRQGISVAPKNGVAKNTFILGNSITNINGTNPQSGIDLEPETNGAVISCRILGNYIYGCAGRAFTLFSKNTSEIYNIVVSNNVFNNESGGSYAVSIGASSNVILSCNVIKSATSIRPLVVSASNAQIYGNMISATNSGIYISGNGHSVNNNVFKTIDLNAVVILCKVEDAHDCLITDNLFTAEYVDEDSPSETTIASIDGKATDIADRPLRVVFSQNRISNFKGTNAFANINKSKNTVFMGNVVSGSFSNWLNTNGANGDSSSILKDNVYLGNGTPGKGSTHTSDVFIDNYPLIS